jgi:hypothetical protein
MSFLERKVELWLVALVAILGLLGMVIWGNVAIYAEKGGTRGGPVTGAIHELSSLPSVWERMTNTNRYVQIADQTRFEGQSGFSYRYPAGTRPDAGYLLLSRYDGDDRRSYVELVDLNAQKVIHRWAPDIDAINERSVNFSSTEIVLERDANQGRMLTRHPFVTEDGSLLIKDKSPLTKIDACSNVVWINDAHPFHHTTERDADGMFWAPTVLHPPTIDKVANDTFLEDAVTAIDSTGKITFTKSVAQIFLDNGLPHVVYGTREYVRNPIHLNDIEPVDADGPYWKKGDLFLSLRSISSIVLYRPSTNRIIWRKDGPWSMQHDVDILDDHRISVYNNNAGKFAYYGGSIGPNEVMIYDFATDTVSSPWKDAMTRLDVRSATESLATILPEGELFFEEQESGRIMRITGNGETVWQFINRARDGLIYRVGWSRLLSADEGEDVSRALASTNCGKRKSSPGS